MEYKINLFSCILNNIFMHSQIYTSLILCNLISLDIFNFQQPYSHLNSFNPNGPSKHITNSCVEQGKWKKYIVIIPNVLIDIAKKKKKKKKKLNIVKFKSNRHNSQDISLIEVYR